METHYITARQILDIVLNAFKPDDVAAAVDLLLRDPANAPGEVIRGVVAALRTLEEFGAPDALRSIDMVSVELRRAGISVPMSEVLNAVRALAGASQGAMTMLNDGRFRLNTSVEELERRVGPWARNTSSARRASTFKAEPRKPDIT